MNDDHIPLENKGEKVIGVVIMSGAGNNKKASMGKEMDKRMDQLLQKSLSKNIHIKQFTLHMNYFFQLCMLDLQEKMNKSNYHSILQLSK